MNLQNYPPFSHEDLRRIFRITAGFVDSVRIRFADNRRSAGVSQTSRSAWKCRNTSCFSSTPLVAKLLRLVEDDTAALRSVPTRTTNLSTNRISTVDSFETLSKVDSAVTVFSSARTRPGNPYNLSAQSIAHLLARENLDVITGGGSEVVPEVFA